MAARIESFRDLLRLIPVAGGWRDAEIMIQTYQDPFPVRRVSLHVGADGRKVILLHDRVIETPATERPPAAPRPAP